MQSWRSFPALFGLTLAVTACGRPAEPTAQQPPVEVPRYTIEQFLDNTAVAGASVSPDKSKILVSADHSGIFNAYAVPVAGGTMEPLTASTSESLFALSYFPADERFLYTADQGGNELNHIYVRELDGSVRDLTPGDELKANFLGWAQDDQSFLLSTNERDNRYFDIYEVSLDTYERRLLFQDDVGYQYADLSPDRRYVALNKPRTTYDSDIYLHDRQTGATRHLTPHEGDVSFQGLFFSTDGDRLYAVSDDGHEFSYLVRYDLAAGTWEEVLKTQWDVLFAFPSKHGKYLAVAVNADAQTDLQVYEAATMTPIALPELPEADITSVGFSRDESLMTFYASSSRQPQNLWVHELAGGTPRRLTDTLNPQIDPQHLVDTQVVRFASYDGVPVPGLLYKPHGAGAQTQVPAVVWVHGGPGGQSRVGFNPLIQYLVNHGYAVYAINNRGSSGYGKTFFRMDDQKHGDADLGDCVASKRMLIDTGYVDPQRIGIVGGSYGGYMVLAALTLRPDEFAAGVDLFGISNWVRTLEAIPPWWESFREALYKEMGDPKADRERLERISPLFHAAQIQKPLMVLQGANDPRVLQVESDSIVEAVKAQGVPVEYVVFEDEGHGFLKKENRIEGYRKLREFLDQYLKGGAPAVPPATT